MKNLTDYFDVFNPREEGSFSKMLLDKNKSEDKMNRPSDNFDRN